jgi:preprotein translocase subunit YajC
MHQILEAVLTQAGDAQSSPAGGLGMFLPLILIFVVFYFLMIRPQAKQQKKHQEFVSSLKKGDEVVTTGGVIGRVVQVEDRAVQIDVGGGMKLRIVKAQIVGAWTEKGAIEPAKAEAKK